MTATQTCRCVHMYQISEITSDNNALDATLAALKVVVQENGKHGRGICCINSLCALGRTLLVVLRFAFDPKINSSSYRSMLYSLCYKMKLLVLS